MITKSELIEYLKHTPENTNYNILYSSLYNGSNKEAVDEFIEVLSRGNLSLAALQPYLAKLYEDDKTISPEPLPPFSSGGGSVPKPLTYDYMPAGYPSKSRLIIEWDGNTEGLTAQLTLYKVSDLVVDPTVFASGATLTYADGSTDFMSTDAASGKNLITIEPGMVVFGEGQVVIFTETPKSPYEAFEIGVYFESDEIYDVRKVTSEEVITPIAEEFLPNIPADKLPAGGSADAVLYTAQTLTEEQKKQARQNIDAGVNDFMVNGTFNSDGTLTLDKTFDQIREAVNSGEKVLVRATSGTISMLIPLAQYSEDVIEFWAAGTRDKFVIANRITVTRDGATAVAKRTPALNAEGKMPQVYMSSGPAEDMQIATKKYVDDHATGGIDMDITGATVGQIAKITAVDESGKPTAWAPADMPSGGSTDAVLYTEQDLTGEQKQQARNNIGAASSAMPTISSPVSLCPLNITDINDAVQIIATKANSTDFSVNLRGGPEIEPVRVDGIRTPTYDDIDSAANVEFVLHASYIVVENSQVTEYVFSEINEEYERGTCNIWLEPEDRDIRLASCKLMSDGSFKLIFIDSSDGAGIEVHSVTVSESNAEYAVTSMANGNEVSY